MSQNISNKFKSPANTTFETPSGPKQMEEPAVDDTRGRPLEFTPGEEPDPGLIADNEHDLANGQLHDEYLEEDSELESDSESTGSDTDSDSDLQVIIERDDITLSDSITNEIRKGVYTCLVCTGEVDSTSRIWSCHLCYRVYDVDCIRSWATKGSSTDVDRSWRCPSCNGKHHKIPKSYHCWCGKVTNPLANILNPHSCSNTCNHQLPLCSHGCSLSCHPGPHLKRCGAIGPVMSCRCGETERQLPCVMTPYGHGWSCDKVCNDLLPCGVHRCNRKCHSGLCGPCDEPVEATCYCGRHTQVMKCSDRVLKKSSNTVQGTWTGAFQCQDKCGHPLSCGNHFCNQECHPHSPQLHSCPWDPSHLRTCPCGKVAIEELVPGGRQSCLEPVPNCDNVCGKTLPCGHECIWTCHEGACSPCYRLFTEKCSCQYSQFLVTCRFLQDGARPKCTHKCQALLNCRRHRCQRVCCADEPVAMKRERNRAKMVRRLLLGSTDDDAMNIEAVHICTRECGKLLACGKHHCQRSCHLGPCPPCLESASDDLVCSCGNTVVPAPVRCGTKLPPCMFPCPRTPPCGHLPVPHNCHEDPECPKCTRLVVKQCQCHRRVPVKNVMCFQDVVMCGNVCGLPLPCGHKCLKTCHKPGECLLKCGSKCGVRRSCGHPDSEPCHFPKECDEKMPCSTMVRLSCDCKRITKEIPCGATLTKPSSQDTSLDCDDECLRVERNRRLFEALKTHTNFGSKNASVSSSSASTLLSQDLIHNLLELENPYPKEIIAVYYRQKTWCLNVERIFRSLLLSRDPARSTHHFPPMIKLQRQFIHQLADVYRFFSQSQDPEPKRNVMIQKLPYSRSPTMTLQEGYQCAAALKERDQLKKNKLANGVKELQPGVNEKDIYFNAIAIADVYFGVTRDGVEKCVMNLVEDSISSLSLLQKPINVTYINDTTYLLYGLNHQDTSLKLEQELRSLTELLKPKLKLKSVLLNCKLCKLDELGLVIYEIEQEKVENEEKEEKLQSEEHSEIEGSVVELQESDGEEQDLKEIEKKTEVLVISQDDEWW